MQTNYLLFVLFFFLLPALTNAQFCSEEQKEVWTVVEDRWENWKNKDIDASFETVSDQFR